MNNVSSISPNGHTVNCAGVFVASGLRVTSNLSTDKTTQQLTSAWVQSHDEAVVQTEEWVIFLHFLCQKKKNSQLPLLAV